MRVLLIGLMVTGLPCAALAGPVKAEKTASSTHANTLVHDVTINAKARIKTVVPGTVRVALVEDGKTQASKGLLSREKQRLTIKQKKSATLIHISQPQ